MKYKHFTVEEREVIQRGLWKKKPISRIAKELGRHPTSVAREIKRNLPPERERYTPRLANEKALAKRKSRGRATRRSARRAASSRYADDFVILSRDTSFLKKSYRCIDTFLQQKLRLQLHPAKCFIKTYASGIDFLGWVHFPDHRVLRTSTTRRMLKRVAGRNDTDSVVVSYLGMLKHGNTAKLRRMIAATE